MMVSPANQTDSKGRKLRKLIRGRFLEKTNLNLVLNLNSLWHLKLSGLFQFTGPQGLMKSSIYFNDLIIKARVRFQNNFRRSGDKITNKKGGSTKTKEFSKI